MNSAEWEAIRRKRLKAKQKLYRLVQIQRRACFWCRGWIALKSEVAGKTVVENTVSEVAWLEGGEILRAGWATIDHVVPRSEGGKNAYYNLVAACHDCNQDRNWLASQIAYDFEKLRAIRRESTLREQRVRIEARRASKLYKCDRHKKFETVAEAVEFRDEVQRIAKVRAVFFQCNRCKKWRVCALDRPRFQSGKKRLSRLFTHTDEIEVMNVSGAIN